jgi:uncharacterized membrane protein
MTSLDSTAKAPASRSSQLPTILIGAAFLLVAIVFAASSDLYDAFMAVHVTFVVVWVGGGAALTILGIVAQATGDGAQLAAIAKQAAFLGQRVFAPAGIIVVAMGVAMVLRGHIGFDHFWTVFGMLGFLSTFIIGVAVLRPMSESVAKILEEKGVDAPESRAAVEKILLIARADIAVLLLVVVDMVTKPFS